MKVPNLGNYEFKVETHEIPSHEVLPIIDKSYFPSSVTTYMSEVDNTAPSALYEAKTVAKVDIVFAFGDYGQLSLMEDTIPSFTASLQEASNHIDAKVTSVETTTGGFDINATTPEEIIATWTQHPNPNSFRADGNKLISHGSQQAFTYDRINSGTHTRMSGICQPHIGPDHMCGFICKWNQENDTCLWVGIEEHCAVVVYMTGVRCAFGECGAEYIYLKADGTENFRYPARNSGLWTPIMTPCYYIESGHVNVGQTYTIPHQLTPWNGVNVIPCKSTSPAGTYTVLSLGKLDINGDHKPMTFTLDGNHYKLVVDATANSRGITLEGNVPFPITEGVDGVFCSCYAEISNFSIECENIVKKSLGESISDVDWRDNSTRFIIHCTDSIPVEMEEGRESDYQYTITKLLNSNAYLINLGTNFNKSKLNELLGKLTTAEGIKQGTYFDNSNVNSALTNSKNYIVNIVKNLAKPENWILVNEQVYWNTIYNDQEHDLPLNLGEHDGTKNQDDSDVKLTSSWGVALEHLYTSDKILAEKWRYRHFNNYFDNSTVREGFHEVWLDNPVEIFPNPGLYRINYKRKDNPFHPNVDLTHEFDNYRYWSTDYDRRE